MHRHTKILWHVDPLLGKKPRNKQLYNSHCHVTAPHTSMFPRQQGNTAIKEETFSTRSVPWCHNLDQLVVEDSGVSRGAPASRRVQYLHRSPASRRRRRKGNPVPRGITGPPCSWWILIRGPGTPGWGAFESETVKYGHESRGTGTHEWLPWRRRVDWVKNTVSNSTSTVACVSIAAGTCLPSRCLETVLHATIFN
jgi:hypothetical protein